MIALRLRMTLFSRGVRVRSRGGGVEADAGSLVLAFPEGWLDAHPLTEADLAREGAYLKSAGFALRID